MAQADANSPDNQQRAFVRVDDQLPLSWRKVDPDEFSQMMAHFQKHQSFPVDTEEVGSLLNDLDVADKILQLERSDPVMARILSRLDMKLNLLIKVFYPGNEARPMVPTWVNLSGGGLAFKEVGPDLNEGDVVEIRLGFSLESLASIQCFARVVKMFAPDADEMVKVACQFEPILDQDREKLIQHIFKKQSELLRASRGR